jgi:hypothetical protein
MGVASVSGVMKHLTLDVIEHIAAAFGSDRTNSQIAIGAAIPALLVDGERRRQRGRTTLSPPGLEPWMNPARRAEASSLSLLCWLTSIAAVVASFIQPSRGVGVHSKWSHSPWKPCSSRYLLLPWH